MTSHIELISVPLGDGTATLECSVCGPIGITLSAEARAELLRHLTTVHQGARA